jgi:hypothetical protein
MVFGQFVVPLDTSIPMDYTFKPLHDGIQILFRFENGKGLSVVRHQYSYGGSSGLWEAAPVEFSNEGWNGWEFIGQSDCLPGFVYDDVKGWLHPSDIDELIGMVADLPANRELTS